MDFSGNIASFGTGTYTVTRAGAPTVVDGYAVGGEETTFTITASVQNLTGKELIRDPEAMQAPEERKLYTVTRLQAINSPDTISIDGEDWEVSKVEDFSILGNYFKVTVVKVNYA